MKKLGIALSAALIVLSGIASAIIPLLISEQPVYAAVSQNDWAAAERAASFVWCIQKIGLRDSISPSDAEKGKIFKTSTADNELQVGTSIVLHSNIQTITQNCYDLTKPVLSSLGTNLADFLRRYYNGDGTGDYNRKGGEHDGAIYILSLMANDEHKWVKSDNYGVGSLGNYDMGTAYKSAVYQGAFNYCFKPSDGVKNDQTVKDKKYTYKEGISGSTNVDIGIIFAPNTSGRLTCDDIAKKINSDKDDILNPSAKDKEEIDASGVNASGGTGPSGDETPSCDASGNALAWAICPLVNGLGHLVDWIFNSFIIPFLKVNPISTTPTSSSYRVWSGFRLIANILLVIIFIVMIFGQAIGGGLIDAYTTKKVLPRLAIGAIGINLSIYMVAVAVDITNVVGAGLGDLITAPFSNSGGGSGYAPGVMSGAVGLVIILLTAGIALFSIGKLSRPGNTVKGGVADFRKSTLAGFGKDVMAFLLLFVGLPVAIVTIAIFFTLILRLGIIVIGAAVAPVAVALWILPSTEQYFKKWWSLFSKALLVYPIVVTLFAVGDVMAYAFGGDLLSGNGHAGINGVIAIFAQFAPLAMIPYAFKFAGGIIGGIHDTVKNRGKQGAEFVKGRENDENSLRNRTKRNAGESFTRGQAGLANRYLNHKPTAANPRPSFGTRTLGRLAALPNSDQRIANANKAALQRRENLRQTGADDLIFAGAGYEDKAAGKYYDSRGKEITRQKYKKGKRLYGSSQHDLQASLGYSFEKSQTEEDLAHAYHSFLNAADENNWDETEMKQAWAGITFPNKALFAGAKHAAPVIDPAGNRSFETADNLQVLPAGATPSSGRAPVPFIPHKITDKQRKGRLSELHKTRESFKLSQIRDTDFQGLYERQRELEASTLAGTATADDHKELLQTYEVFDAISQKVRAGGGPIDPDNPETTTSGATPAAQTVINAATNNRKLGIRNDSNGVERQLVERAPAPLGAPLAPGTAGPVAPGHPGAPPVPPQVYSGMINTTQY